MPAWVSAGVALVGLLDGGGGGGGQPASSSNVQSGIPDYARPYVDTMLGATQQQLFNYAQNPETGQMEPTTIKPYQAFGQNGAGIGQGEMASARSAVAGPTDLQNRSYQGAADIQMPEQYGQATGLTGLATLGSLNAGQNFDPYQTGQFGAQVGQYMSPYMQSVVKAQMDEANRNYNIAGTQQASQATQSGAFGGSRGAIMAAENERNRNTALNNIQAAGLQSAFQNAQGQFNTDQQLREQSRQYGAGLGMQGYGQAIQGAGQLAGIGGQALAAQQGILGLQNQFGAQQQGQQQNVLNQAIQNYSNTQQYPQQQLAFMNSQLRGLPLTNATTTQYQAAPSMLSQVAGLGTAAYGASKLAGSKKGGVIKAPDNRNKKPGGLMDLALDKIGA